jgi:3-hydroxyisobutyrate dehydrogenase-like beta-hydroxyacid dehydrogenase
MSGAGNRTRIAFIGFGEAGGILGAALAARGDTLVTAYDILLDDEVAAPAMGEKAARSHVVLLPSLEELLTGAELVFSAVTASEAAKVATDAARHMKEGQVFLDINSVSPTTKQRNASAIEESGARFIEVAVMAPVPPKGLAVPLLIGGAGAADMAQTLNALGMNARVASEKVGAASAIKMCRSVFVKGLEALTTEALRAARHYGAEDEVLASLAASYPAMGWDKELPDYLVSRIAVHGRRRAAEMREVGKTLSDAGVAPRLAAAIAELEDALIDELEAASLPSGSAAERDDFSWREMADALAKKA